ncbi:hypothetical protein PR202_gb04083 [Eleusine coracana subsp. coracana]|uniref:Peptidase S8/S53 domain-containing protein n=1 Tax=Eleusine coracana subsp. coracana TaxID=191504 RepID=A0AAV5E338_ELECO|nr:hypothetical protein PR202_gb04083 [Eleusine coracana subsp. coracana]
MSAMSLHYDHHREWHSAILVSVKSSTHDRQVASRGSSVATRKRSTALWRSFLPQSSMLSRTRRASSLPMTFIIIHCAMTPHAGPGIHHLHVQPKADWSALLQKGLVATNAHLKEATSLLNYIKYRTLSTCTLKLEQTKLGIQPAPVVVNYSSRGPSQSSVILKPDIMAPGHNIIASVAAVQPSSWMGHTPLWSNFGIMSGTSMVCLHASGVAALLHVVHPDWTPAMIKSAIMATTTSTDNTLRPITDARFENTTVASPLAMGSGQSNWPTPLCKISLASPLAAKYTDKQIMAITRSSTAYNCSISSIDVNYPSFIANATSGGMRFSRTVTNVRKAMAVYHVSWDSPR